jgi:hypothetical protein
MVDSGFEPGFLIRVECDLGQESFSEWFFNKYADIGVEKISVSMGKLGLNIITIGLNDGYDPQLYNTEDGYLYYRYSIEVYRGDPLPAREDLIEEQLGLCKLFLTRITEQGWLYGLIGEIKQFLNDVPPCN